MIMSRTVWLTPRLGITDVEGSGGVKVLIHFWPRMCFLPRPGCKLLTKVFTGTYMEQSFMSLPFPQDVLRNNPALSAFLNSS